MLEVSRKQVLAYRIARHGLHRTEQDPVASPQFDLGLQDSMRDTAVLALAARSAGEVTPTTLVDDPRVVLVWSHRGAPHFHRRDDLRELTTSLIPLDDADALARMLWQKKEIGATGVPASEVLFTAAKAIRKVVKEPMSKGAVSAAVTRELPEAYSRWCRPCNATHIQEQLMRLATLHGGVRLEADQSPATLAPLEGRARLRTTPDAAAVSRVVRGYLTVNGPATQGDAAGFVGTAKTALTPAWPEDLTEVSVDGRKTFLPTAEVSALENPPAPSIVRLLPPLDPFTQARDKTVLVPDKARAKEVWKILGSPGALLVDGELMGVWRTRGSGKRLAFTMTAFDPLRATDRAAAEEEAERAAKARGYADLSVTWA
ncbi:crosslink repair DNA glycosylase YcaQ family protein [Amycolatopsis rhabdoformis]|uniref:Crosslink repair DNA glycosylase YcaQ family protein n=1 Tax=Amycolatopsis rhabdoformis TaxID=1448059 RepID=A0ABZ1I557_9PSEU|nr:crosslink repair DNA glycosylase YcaQ family protein [Amycolatopsis rhabdoformis]WSE29533.1 crosslink repair DNA glycosylase YcaQ family protein [Amycolatopsis rhabdoformis]